MSIPAQVKVVLRTAKKLVRASEGTSNDVEIAVGHELLDDTIDLIRQIAARDIEVADLLDKFDAWHTQFEKKAANLP
jgi:hypothetical protein